MTSAVYSTCFYAVANVGGSIGWAVPAGHTAVLHQISLYLPASHSVAVGYGLTVALDDPTSVIWELWGPNSTRGMYLWQGRDVFTTELIVGVTFPAYALRASGYLLTNP